jgi:hypothetical protein
MRQRTASRRARNGRARPGCGPPAVVILHNVKQPAPRLAPRNTSRSRAASLRRGLSLLFVSTASPLPSPTIPRACARNLGRHQLRPRTEGSAERREAHCLSCRAGKTRLHACEALIVPRNRDARLSALHRGVARRPLRLRRSRGKAGSPAIVHGGLRTPGVTPRLRAATDRHLPAPPAGSSPEDAPHERG